MARPSPKTNAPLVRCQSCGAEFDPRNASDFCPHTGSYVGLVANGVVVEHYNDEAKAAAAERALNEKLAEAFFKLPGQTEFRTWYARAESIGPMGEFQHTAWQLHIEIAHDSHLKARAVVEALPDLFHGFETYFHGAEAA